MIGIGMPRSQRRMGMTLSNFIKAGVKTEPGRLLPKANPPPIERVRLRKVPGGEGKGAAHATPW